MRVGRRLAIKLLNASKFVLARPSPVGAVTAPVDRGLLTSLAQLTIDATADLGDYNYTRALERTEAFFWDFCDNYLELVKSRRYGDLGEDGAASANAAMQAVLHVLLRLFAPFLPFVTEEVWSWWRQGSVHRAPWPTSTEVLEPLAGPDERGRLALAFATEVLGAVRRAKSEAQKPLRTPVTRLTLRLEPGSREWLDAVRADVMAAGFVQQIDVVEAEAFGADVELGDPVPGPSPGQ
jgi:valyl-tRNA synthetase